VASRVVTVLIDSVALDTRRAIAAGPLAPLATSLRTELERLIQGGFEVPHEKALLSRDGGRCERDGTLLRFDPFSPREHTCPRCAAVYRRERDYLWWITSYQLWLAERAVYAAALHALTPEAPLRRLAEDILDAYVARYLEYPNRDNALGPTRPFFSTYLESIWLLQLVIALSLLESSGRAGDLGARVRDRIVEPSARLIASFDEGDSNRQVWNAAGLAAAGRILENTALVERALLGGSGIMAHLGRGLLPDGSWYEGENYHVFAHRGLWYGVTMAEHAGCSPPRELVRRFEEAFAIPLVTALPDLTIPSRRDSQYAISLRQWRFAESFELGLARVDDARLAVALRRLYDDAVPRRDPGRWRSAADTQPHESASALTRGDLGWRALLFARATLPPLTQAALAPPRSALLEAQGLAVFRRDAGRTYVTLDYGHSGGGHGHPDRLNLLFARDDDRILDDYGTGSYVDPSLHWYRSTLAHNAPLFEGVSQQRSSGNVLAHEELGAVGWIDAEVPWSGLAPNVRVRRSVIMMNDYCLDRLEWESENVVRAELPIHVVADIPQLEFRSASLEGGSAPEDGFSFIRDAQHAVVPDDMAIRMLLRLRGASGVDAWVLPRREAEWWRAEAPGPPGEETRRFSLIRVKAAAGSITSVWSWGGAVTGVEGRDDTVIVHRGDQERHEHARRGDRWSVTLYTESARSSIELGGVRPAPDELPAAVPFPTRALRVGLRDAPITFKLGESAYRRSEQSWEEAGRPSGKVVLAATDDRLIIVVTVEKAELTFRAPEAPDPAFDNEHPDIHSDGVQLYIAADQWDRAAAWLAVPEQPEPRVRIRAIDGARANVPLSAEWRRQRGGYEMRFELPLDALGSARRLPLSMDVIVNDMTADRLRRRGQLVLSGGGGWVYLQGDRQSAARFLPIVVDRD
jgi:hypothetical protein